MHIKQTKKWLETVVIGLNLCPFAKREYDHETIDYQLLQISNLEAQLEALISACQQLDSNAAIETSLLIYPSGLDDFYDYLDFLELSNQLLEKMGYVGIYQLASFHPDYQFEDTEFDDPANYSNRSPYPMLHLLREQSLEKAIAAYPDPENIPKRNIQNLRQLGYEEIFKKLRDSLEV